MPYDTLYAAIISTSNKYFAGKVNPSFRERTKLWWTQECITASKNAKKAYKTWRSTLLLSDKIIVNKLEDVKEKIILREKNKCGNTENNKSCIINGTMDDYTSASLRKLDGELTSDPLEKANIYLDQVSPANGIRPAVNTNYEVVVNQHLQVSTRNALDLDFSIGEPGCKSLIYLRDKSMDIDRIHNRMLKT